EALALARRIEAAPGLRCEGLMAYPPRGAMQAAERRLKDAIALLEQNGIAVKTGSNGGAQRFYSAATVTSDSEHPPVSYISCDRMQVALGHVTLEDCALTVLATGVSRPTPDRAVLDTGSKALAADKAPVPGHGHIVEYPDAVITTLNEEHGIVDLSACARKPEIGEKVRIIPNHVCVVSNLFDAVNLTDGENVLETVPVAARGKLT